MEAQKEPGRRLRARERRRYTEEFGDEEIEGKRMFSVEEKLLSDRFDDLFVKDMKGEELSLRYLQENGFDTPIVVKTKTGLGLKMPEKGFSVNDVRQCVGSRRLLDVMDVTTQKDIEMTVKEWCRYYEDPVRERLLNVISLEFSHTKLETLVEGPMIVRQVDWVDWVWPKHLKESQTEGTNSLDDMKYPKVQKYCLMSVKGCYTDFHIDFGGTSVWYHILKGQKVFWLIPPSEKNIQLFEQWVLSGKQTDIFFGDTVEQCARIRLQEGYTFFIPTGWIHAVYTPEDSLVFGGNFLHSFGIEKQLRIAQVEDVTKVPTKFRYPFYNEMLWYVLQRYVFCLTSKTHLTCQEDGTPIPEAQQPAQATNGSLSIYSSASLNCNNKPKICSLKVHLSPFELNGLKAIIMWLSRPASNKRSVPDLVANPEALLNDAKLLVDDHVNDEHRLSCTGKPVLFWASKQSVKSHSSPLSVTTQLRQFKNNSFSNSSLKAAANKLLASQNQSNANTNATSEPSTPRPESPPTRPISSNQYAVNASATPQVLDQIPNSFVELIAATGVVSSNVRPSFPSLTACVLSSVVTSSFSSTTSTTTQTLPLSVPLLLQQNALEQQQQQQQQTTVASSVTVVSESKTISTSVGTTECSLQPNSKLLSVGSTAKNSAANDSSRRRRTRCKKCEACLRADCGECHFCKDMKKFGGPGRMKQSCIARQCMAPVLPHTACCMICGRDGWEKLIAGPLDSESQSSLMECSQCWEIVHPFCLKEKDPALSLQGNSNDDLPNSWECPKCMLSGKPGLLKPRQLKPTIASTAILSSITSSSGASPGKLANRDSNVSSDSPPKKPRLEEEEESSEEELFVKSSENETDDESSSSDPVVSHKSSVNCLTSSNSSESSQRIATPLSSASAPLPPQISITTSTATNSQPVASSHSPANSHVRSCARFPLLQEAIKQQQEEKLIANSSTVKVTKSESKASLNSQARSKKSSETSRDRLFRSLKGLKKSSEMMRFSNSSSVNTHPFNAKKTPSHRLTPLSGLRTSDSSSSSCGSSALNSPSYAHPVVNNNSTSPVFNLFPDDSSLANDRETANSRSEPCSTFDDETDNDTDHEFSTVCTIEKDSPSSSDGDDEDDESGKNKPNCNRKPRSEVNGRELRKPKFVVRPAPLPEDISETEEEEDEDEDAEDMSEEETTRNKALKKRFAKFRRKRKGNLALERDVVLPFLPYLTRRDLINCTLVCRQWNGWTMDPKLWTRVDLTRKKIDSTSLVGIVRRQPIDLNLSWTNINKRQLSWLIARLPQLQTLSLSGCSASVLSALCTCNCPLLKSLDISWVDSLNDDIVKELLSQPSDSRPGLMDTKTRLRQLVEIKVSGSEVSDVSVRLMSQHLQQLARIDLSNCHKVTDMGIAVLGAAKSSKLTSLNVSSCSNISDTSLDALRRCQNLYHLDLRDCTQVSPIACQKFVSLNSRHRLVLKQSKLIDGQTVS